jgi:Fe-S cluster biogenesis protein NfuA
MDPQQVREAFEEPVSMLRADGADLVVVEVDAARSRVTARLVLEGAGCEECVLPAARLEEILADSLRRRLHDEVEVELHDPREGARDPREGARDGGPPTGSANGQVAGAPHDATRPKAPAAAPPAGRIRIRVPVAERQEIVGAPAYTVGGPLDGLRVGLRHEGSWRSWMLIVDDWERFLLRDGAKPVVLQTGERIGELGSTTAADVAAWTDVIDCGISGLGTCGSCTSWSVHDATTLEGAGKPAIVAVCKEFVPHARNMAAHLGHPDLKVLELPYPLEARPEEELHQVAVDYYPDFLRLLGVTG